MSLGDRLRRGPLPPRKAVEYVVQVCHGLAAAHAKGIVHRDLKPSNLFLTTGGRVKILDFGLAKLSERLTPEGEPDDSRTRSTATGQEGVLGTVGYMSPEQVRGRPADARSDIFSLGATFYEMLAGRRAFQAETSADTLSAILNHEPPEITGPAESLPPALDRIVRRCLEKDADERFQSARDVAFALEALALGSRSGAEPAVAGPRSRRRWLIGTAGAALLAAGGALGCRSRRRSSQRPLPTIQQLTFRRGMVDWARFTSDGKTVVYGAYWDGNPPEIFTTRLESQESRSLGLPSARLLAVSSRGRARDPVDQARRCRRLRNRHAGAGLPLGRGAKAAPGGRLFRGLVARRPGAGDPAARRRRLPARVPDREHDHPARWVRCRVFAFLPGETSWPFKGTRG